MINETFANWSSDLNPLPSNYEELNLHLNTDELKTIQPYEVFNYLSKINIRKSGGPDDIPNWILRDFAFALADPVSHIFNQSLKLGKVPKLWKMANVVVIPKSNPPSSIETDLRPISLTPTLSKILESIIGHWALPNIRPQLDCRQYGGIKGRSTTHELITILHQCHEAVENHKIVRMLLIDFKKAFDHVDHNIVIRKLTELNVKPFIVRWIFSFLQNRQQRIKIGDITSSWSALNGGMPQGSWLGPLIFIILINDLRAEDELFKFIDDVTLLDEIDRTNLSSSSAQSSLDTIAEWSDENFMTINIKKTKEIIYNISRNKIDLPKLSLSGSDIEQVETYKLLGVVLSNDLRWDEHVSYINKKVNKRIHYLKLLKRSGVPTAALLHYYTTVIRSVIEYAAPVWQSSLNNKQRNKLESLQKRSFRIIFNDNDYELNCALNNTELLTTRLENTTKCFYEKILCNNTDVLYEKINSIRTEHTRRDSQYSLRHFKSVIYPCKTNRFLNSFIPHVTNKYCSLNL